jgi:hypothetical protein
MRLESFLSCTFQPVSKARTNKLCILRQCKYIKETLSEERHKKISNILSNTESETNRNPFQQAYLVKPPQILQPVALLIFRVEAIPMFLIIYLNKLNWFTEMYLTTMSNTQMLSYWDESFVKIVYTFTICYGWPRRKT